MTRPARAVAIAVALLAATTLTACGGADPTVQAEKTSTPPTVSSSPTTSPAPATPVPAPTVRPARGKHNVADLTFAATMVAHHAQAIEMTQLLLAKTDIDPVVRTFAEQIKKEQGPEIELMRGWLARWDQPVPAPNGAPTGNAGRGTSRLGNSGHDLSSLPGMMSAGDMAALKHLDGVEGAKLFLLMTVNHHLGAVQMANDELATGRNGDTKKLAQAIIDTQQTEVRTGNELLDGSIHPPGKF